MPNWHFPSRDGKNKLSEIGKWLAELGLEKYLFTFEEAEIDFETLSDLAEDDLKELGLPLGPRRKAWGAIQRLGSVGITSAVAPNVATPQESASISEATSSDAERRHLTVMFVDLVGSTEMATRMDAEDMRDVITSYQNTVAGVVSRFEGFIAKFMGDGVLCYFGWPRANEDDAERAVRAGLSIIDAVKKTKAPNGSPLSTRVGIATGVVIVGDLIGSGATQEAAVVGETPNLAARLQGVADLNQLVVAKETQRLLGTIFDLALLDGQELKGIAGPVDAYRVEGEATVQSRFAAHQSGTLTPIIGREREIELMTERWAMARSSQGQLALVTGEAGIGKSRITQAVIDEVAQEEHIRMTYQCSPYHADSAFYPVIQQISFVAGFASSDSPDVRLDKLEALIGADQDALRLVSPLLGLDGVSRYDALDLTPAQQRARTMQALVGLLVRQAADKPVLLVYEDLHWIDPTSLELLDILLDAIADQPIMILATARPTFEHGFGGHPIVTRFALNRLGKDQVGGIVFKLTDGKALPDEIMEIIAQRTDGVPLFVEELTKTILESDALKEAGERYVLNGPLSAIAIPATLHDSLMARLDRLQPIKEVAQTAACIGRDFSHGLLLQISHLSDAKLTAALDGLIAAELIYRRGLPPEATYLFKHALVRDAAYESLLKDKRRAVHTSILMALENEPDVAPEILAVHAEAAGLDDRAIDLWEAASNDALARPAYRECISHLHHAIGLISLKIRDGQHAAVDHALALQLKLGLASLQGNGYAADDTRAAFEQALVLADKIGETPLRFQVLYGLWVGMYVRGEHAEALQQAERLRELAKGSEDVLLLSLCSRLVGVSLFMHGQFVQAEKHFQESLALFDPIKHQGTAERFGQDLGVSIHCYLAWNAVYLGETRRAEKHADQAEKAALAMGHVNTICYMHAHIYLAALATRDDDELKRHASAQAAIAEEYQLALWQRYAGVALGLVKAGEDDQSGIDELDRYLAEIVAMRTQSFVPGFRVDAARRSLTLGDRDRARDLAAMAEEMMDATGEVYTRSDLHRLKGELALDRGDIQAAETNFQKAVDVARGQGAKLLELRASVDLARLWRDQGKNAEAVSLLQPIHDSIADGDCPEDRSTALELLAALAAG